MNANLDIRPSPIAGQWYEADPRRLSSTVDRYIQPRKESGDGFEYSLACAVESGTTVRVQREFKLTKCDFLVSYYDAVRGFFDRVRAADEEPVLLSAVEK